MSGNSDSPRVQKMSGLRATYSRPRANTAEDTSQQPLLSPGAPSSSEGNTGILRNAAAAKAAQRVNSAQLASPQRLPPKVKAQSSPAAHSEDSGQLAPDMLQIKKKDSTPSDGSK